MTNPKHTIRWFNVGYYGEIAGSIIVDGKPAGKVCVAPSDTALLVTLAVNQPTTTCVTTTHSVDISVLRDERGNWNPKGIRQAGREAVAIAIAQQSPH